MKKSGWPRLTIEEMHKLAFEHNGECLSTEYKNARTLLEWKCHNNHTWAACADSIKRGSWCPQCPKDSITKENFPEIYEFIADKSIDISLISRGATKLLSCKCPDCKKDFNLRACDLTKKEQKGKGLCTNKFCKRSPYRFTMSLRGSTFLQQCPECLDYWDYDKNDDHPEFVTANTEELRFFKCPRPNCNYEWQELIPTFYARYKNSHKLCRKCSPVFYEQEMRIYTEFSALGLELKHRYKISNYEFDLFCVDLNLLIEYDGKHWHSDGKKINFDRQKQNFAIENNYNFIRIREEGLPKIFDYEIKDKSRNGESFLNTTKQLVAWIIENLTLCENFKIKFNSYLKEQYFIGQEHYNKIRNSYEPINSLQKVRPDLIHLWGNKNELLPKNYSYGSRDKVWWKCNDNDQHPEHLSAIKEKTRKKPVGCPYCNRKINLNEIE